MSSLSVVEALHLFVPKLIAATIVGGMVGIERELKHKVVGLKTNILICTGATLYTTLAFHLGGDPSRIAAQIVSGIGFLGAGAIFKAKDKIHGLTTAAFIWVVAALGILVGSGAPGAAIVLTFGLLLVVEGLCFVEGFIKTKEKN